MPERLDAPEIGLEAEPPGESPNAWAECSFSCKGAGGATRRTLPLSAGRVARPLSSSRRVPWRDRVGDIPIAGDERSDLTSGAMVVGVTEATLYIGSRGVLHGPAWALHRATREPVFW